MKILIACCFGFGLLLGPASDVFAHQLSPCYRVLTYERGIPLQESVRYLGRFCGVALSPQERAAVHEHMTAAAIREYRFGAPKKGLPSPWKWQYMVEDAWAHNKRRHDSFAIIFGTWWNDDPLMLTAGEGWWFTSGGYKVWLTLKGNKKRYPGSDPKCKVESNLHLARASHLGSMQHLHFMSEETTSSPEAREQRLALTTEKALNWMSFAYEVATGEIPPQAALPPELQARLGLPSIAKNHCVNPENVKIRTLFAHRGQIVKTRDERTPDVALGSMLHILQDSFSPSHACRVARDIDGKPQALLRDVANYTLQDRDEHAALDKHPRWFLDYLRDGTRRYENDPVSVGAWLISAVDQKLPWEKVEAHLRKTIFARVPTGDVSSTETCIETASSDGV